MQYVGRVIRLQIQVVGLKVGERGHRVYDPSGLRPVSEITIEPGGVQSGDVMDIHHASHADSKNVEGTNGVSVLFTSHYEAMRRQFGDHLTDGIAGETVLVECERQITEGDLAAGLLIRGDGARELTLQSIQVAEPCVEFTRYAMARPASGHEVSEQLKLLRDGMRGFYAVYAGEPATVQVGDQVFLA
jgi:hypothetical protein